MFHLIYILQYQLFDCGMKNEKSSIDSTYDTDNRMPLQNA